MSIKLRDLQQWRDFFSKFDFSIFDIIQYAIVVARIDEPEEFRINRDKIVESLFSYRLMKCSGCNHVELAVAQDEDDSCKEGSECDVGFNKDGKNNSKVNSSIDDNLREMNIESNYSYDEAEALTEEIEEESQIVGEVLRIKEILVNHHEQSAEVLLDSLRRLQLMKLSVETLKATGIGKAVNRLCKHVSKKICHLARALIAEWKSVVDAWVEAASDAAVNAVTEGSPDSVKSCTVNVEEGLPSPPLDEGAFLATQTTSIELSQFFDGMDDEGNPRVVCESKRSQGNRRRPPVSPHLPDQTKDQTKRPECLDKETKPVRANAGSIKPSKPALHHTSNGQEKIERRSHGNESKRKLHVNPQNHSDELSVRVKLEETKKRLQEGYQQAENAKKQRTIQVMELHDLPKQGNHPKNFHQKPGSHIRNRMNGRR